MGKQRVFMFSWCVAAKGRCSGCAGGGGGGNGGTHLIDRGARRCRGGGCHSRTLEEAAPAVHTERVKGCEVDGHRRAREREIGNGERPRLTKRKRQSHFSTCKTTKPLAGRDLRKAAAGHSLSKGCSRTEIHPQREDGK
jgi:hypothetical protein